MKNNFSGQTELNDIQMLLGHLHCHHFTKYINLHWRWY